MFTRVPCFRSLLAAATLPFLLTLGCDHPPDAGLHVVVEGGLVPDRDFDQLTLAVHRAETGEPLLFESMGPIGDFPFTYNLRCGRARARRLAPSSRWWRSPAAAASRYRP